MKGQYDIVYVLKNGVQPDELRYSLRSVVRNFPFNKIWFYGGCPEGITPDKYVEFLQRGAGKWTKARSMYGAIMSNDEITDDFWLFNDDFYIMKPFNMTTPLTNGTLYMQAQRIESERGCQSGYTRRLKDCAKELKLRGLDRISYEVHTPMLINRARGLEILQTFSNDVPFRSAYGNYYEIGGIICPDVKINDVYQNPTGDETLLSTSDKSFAEGNVGEYIRGQFKRKCRYER